jgi:hypothetical protein
MIKNQQERALPRGSQNTRPLMSAIERSHFGEAATQKLTHAAYISQHISESYCLCMSHYDLFESNPPGSSERNSKISYKLEPTHVRYRDTQHNASNQEGHVSVNVVLDGMFRPLLE